MIDGNIEKQLKQLEVFSDQEFNAAFNIIQKELGVLKQVSKLMDKGFYK